MFTKCKYARGSRVCVVTICYLSDRFLESPRETRVISGNLDNAPLGTCFVAGKRVKKATNFGTLLLGKRFLAQVYLIE